MVQGICERHWAFLLACFLFGFFLIICLFFYSGQKARLEITSEHQIGKTCVCLSHVGWDEDEQGLPRGRH